MGKSTIARTISREFSKRRELGTSFFFIRGGGDVAHIGIFSTSIAKQLAELISAKYSSANKLYSYKGDITRRRSRK
jgi:hypothetical protein